MTKKVSTRFMAIILGTAGMLATGTAQAGDIPKGYPFNFWSESRSDGSKTVATGRFEQGVEMTEVSGWGIVPFVALGAGYGSLKSEYWNNELAPEIGVKVTHPLRLTKGGWGSVSVGARQRWHEYADQKVKNESNTEVFLQLGFGGDWKQH